MKKEIPRQQSLIVPEIQNPFAHKLHLGKLDMLKIAIMSITIAPIRFLLIILCLLTAWILAAVAVSFRSSEDKKRPLSGWRKMDLYWSWVPGLPRKLYWPVRVISWDELKVKVFCKADNAMSFELPLMVMGRAMAFFIGFQNLKITGTPVNPKEAPLICVAPHSTFFDVIPLFYCKGLPCSISRVENKKAPILSALLEFTQPVLVDRKDPDSRLKTVEQIKERAQAGGIWPQVIIFPEGTCTNRSCLISYKLGAFYPGVPVQPVCLKYPNRLDTVTWTWEGPSAFLLFWLTLCQFNTNMEIEFLPVYKPSEEEKKDPKLFAANVRKIMAEALQVPITDHTYDDCRLMIKAHQLRLPMSAGLVEFQKLHKKLGISLDQMHEMLEKFSDIDLEGKGHITMEQFGKYLQLPESQSLKEVFNLYDRDGSGKIDFREYVIGLSLISAPVNTDSTISLAFQLFDSSQQGYISREDLQLILHNAFGMTEIDVDYLFNEVDADRDDKISYDEFKAFAQEKPEYAPLFLAYQQTKETNTNGNAVIQGDAHPKAE